jgi:hypothetical protein
MALHCQFGLAKQVIKIASATYQVFDLSEGIFGVVGLIKKLISA